MKSREKTREKPRGDVQSSAWLDTMLHLLKGSVAAGVVTAAAMLVCAFGVARGWLPQEHMDGMILAACVLGALTGGVLVMGRGKGRAIPMGLGIGAILFLLLLTGGMLAYGEIAVGGGGLGILLACCCGGAMAGVFCGKPRKKRKR